MIDRNKVVELYNSGKSIAAVAKLLGYSRMYIWTICIQAGVTRSIAEGLHLTRYKGVNERSAHAVARRKMERRLGRKLERWEDVHHKDNNPFNISDGNLEVLPYMEHKKIHVTERAGRGYTKKRKEIEDGRT